MVTTNCIWVDAHSAYDHVAGTGKATLEAKRRKWDDRKLGLQMVMLCVSLFLIMGVMFAAMSGFDAFVNPGAVLLVVAMAALVAVSWIPRLYEHVLGDFHAELKVGCRTLGGPGNLPALLLSLPGPLQLDAERYVKALELDERERECVNLLRDEWSGTIDELVATARSLCELGDLAGDQRQ